MLIYYKNYYLSNGQKNYHHMNHGMHAKEDRWTSEFQWALNSQNGRHIRYAQRRNGRLIKRVREKTKSMVYDNGVALGNFP